MTPDVVAATAAMDAALINVRRPIMVFPFDDVVVFSFKLRPPRRRGKTVQ